MKHGKKYNEIAKLVDRSAVYEPEEAIALVKKTAAAKFDETVEVHIRTGCDGRHAEQQIRGAVVLPNGTGKTVRVLVFAKGDTLAEAEKRVFDLAQRGGGSEFVPIRQVVINVMKKIDAASRARGRITGLETGFIDLDYKTSGLQPSDLVLIAARPSMGKTAFVLNLAQHMAFKREQPVAIFSLEMSKEQLVNRMLSLESHVDAQKIRTGRLNDEEWMNLVEGSANIANSRLFIDDTPGITLPVMRSKCRKLKMEHDIQIVIIDYLQLMSGDGSSNASSRQQEISDISRGLKALARELNVPVVALSQLSRAVEQRPDHRPMLSDLRESGAIEQDADVVMFLYREGYYNRDLSEAEQRVAEVIIAKQRNGPIGTVNLLWIPELTKFTDMEREPA